MVYSIQTIQQRRTVLNELLIKFKYFPFEERQTKLEQLQQLTSVTLPNNLMMTSEQIKQLYRAGMEIGAHTVEHPILTRIDDQQAFTEISTSKETLESIVGDSIRVFSYPNGKPNKDYLINHTHMVKEIGFEAAVSTAWGAANNKTDVFQLPRFTPWDLKRNQFIARMARNMLTVPEVA